MLSRNNLFRIKFVVALVATAGVAMVGYGFYRAERDAILEALAINDNRVVDIHLVKRIAPTHPRVEVELEAIPTWQFDDEYVYLEQPEDGE